MPSLRLFVIGVLATPATEFAEFKSRCRRLLVFCGRVVPTLTDVALEHNIVAWHNLPH